MCLHTGYRLTHRFIYRIVQKREKQSDQIVTIHCAGHMLLLLLLLLLRLNSKSTANCFFQCCCDASPRLDGDMEKTLKPLHKAEGHKNPPWRMMLRCALTLLFVKVDCVYLTSWIIMILMHYVLLNVYAKDPTIKGSWSGSLKRCAIWRTSGAHQY